MKVLIPMNNQGLFGDNKDTARVDSRFVAEAFEKNHKDVLRSIDDLIAPDSGLSPEFGKRNFAPTSYVDQWNRKQRCYAMTRDGFTMLVMGYIGKKAMQFKEAYIQAFNEMEKHIAQLKSARERFPKLTAQIYALNPEAKSYVYANEADMLNRIALGMTAKQYRIAHGIDKDEPLRPHLNEKQIEMLDWLEMVDIGLYLGVTDFQQRKRLLQLSAIERAPKIGYILPGNEPDEDEE